MSKVSESSTALSDGIHTNEVQFLEHCFNWKTYFEQLKMNELDAQIQKVKIQQLRNILIFVVPDPQSEQHSILYVICYPFTGISTILQHSKVLIKLKFHGNSIVSDSLEASMYSDPPIFLDLISKKNLFENWVTEKIMSRTQFESWNEVWDKMELIQKSSCQTCCKLYRKKQQLNIRSYMKDQNFYRKKMFLKD